MSSSEHFHHAPETTELEKYGKRFWRRIEPHLNAILIVLLVIGVGLLGGFLWMRSTSASQAVGWEKFFASKAAEDYLALANEQDNTTVGHWARLQAGMQFLTEGLQLADTNREASNESLENAENAFNTLLQKDVGDSVREGALLGLATTLEATSGENTQPAIDAYRQLLNQFPETTHKPMVEYRIEQLETQEAQQFYAWFQQQNPKPTDRPQPQDRLPNLNFDDPSSLDLELPAPPTPADTDSVNDSAERPEGTPDLLLPELPAQDDGETPNPTPEEQVPERDAPAVEETPASTPESDAGVPPTNPESESTPMPESDAESAPEPAPETTTEDEQPQETTPEESSSESSESGSEDNPSENGSEESAAPALPAPESSEQN